MIRLSNVRAQTRFPTRNRTIRRVNNLQVRRAILGHRSHLITGNNRADIGNRMTFNQFTVSSFTRIRIQRLFIRHSFRHNRRNFAYITLRITILRHLVIHTTLTRGLLSVRLRGPIRTVRVRLLNEEPILQTRQFVDLRRILTSLVRVAFSFLGKQHE